MVDVILANLTPSKTPITKVKRSKASKNVEESESEGEEDEDEGVGKDSGADDKSGSDEGEDATSDSDGEGDPSKLVHESLQKGAQTKGQSRHGKQKFVPSEETPEQRDARTVFVGNVAVEVTKSRVRVHLSCSTFARMLTAMPVTTARTETVQASHPLLRPLRQDRVRPFPFSRLQEAYRRAPR